MEFLGADGSRFHAGAWAEHSDAVSDFVNADQQSVLVVSFEGIFGFLCLLGFVAVAHADAVFAEGKEGDQFVIHQDF